MLGFYLYIFLFFIAMLFSGVVIYYAVKADDLNKDDEPFDRDDIDENYLNAINNHNMWVTTNKSKDISEHLDNFANNGYNGYYYAVTPIKSLYGEPPAGKKKPVAKKKGKIVNKSTGEEFIVYFESEPIAGKAIIMQMSKHSNRSHFICKHVERVLKMDDRIHFYSRAGHHYVLDEIE